MSDCLVTNVWQNISSSRMIDGACRPLEQCYLETYKTQADVKMLCPTPMVCCLDKQPDPFPCDDNSGICVDKSHCEQAKGTAVSNICQFWPTDVICCRNIPPPTTTTTTTSTSMMTPNPTPVATSHSVSSKTTTTTTTTLGNNPITTPFQPTTFNPTTSMFPSISNTPLNPIASSSSSLPIGLLVGLGLLGVCIGAVCIIVALVLIMKGLANRRKAANTAYANPNNSLSATSVGAYPSTNANYPTDMNNNGGTMNSTPSTYTNSAFPVAAPQPERSIEPSDAPEIPYTDYDRAQFDKYQPDF